MQNSNAKFKTDLNARCYQLSLKTIALMDALPQKRSAWVIADQLIRAITSIGANLIEARASSSRLEFKKFYEIALKSANESKYWLGLLRDAYLAGAATVSPLLNEVTEIANMLAKGVMSLKRKPAF
jgi:four helix bundle protein